MMQARILVLLLFFLPAVLFVAASPVHAVTEAVVCIQGVDGDSTAHGFSDCIDVLEFHHLVTGPSAQEHESIVFVKKRQERSTVDLLYLLHNTDERDMTFHFMLTAPTPTVYYQIELQHARIMAIQPWSRDGGTDELERIRVDYTEMRVVYISYDPPGSPESYMLAVP